MHRWLASAMLPEPIESLKRILSIQTSPKMTTVYYLIQHLFNWIRPIWFPVNKIGDYQIVMSMSSWYDLFGCTTELFHHLSSWKIDVMQCILSSRTGLKLVHLLTLNVQGPSYLSLTRSISWLLMPWLLTSPGHQQPWYWLYIEQSSRKTFLATSPVGLVIDQAH